MANGKQIAFISERNDFCAFQRRKCPGLKDYRDSKLPSCLPLNIKKSSDTTRTKKPRQTWNAKVRRSQKLRNKTGDCEFTRAPPLLNTRYWNHNWGLVMRSALLMYREPTNTKNRLSIILNHTSTVQPSKPLWFFPSRSRVVQVTILS